VVNFVGGWLGERCGSAAEVNASLFRRGGGFERPTIWLYGDRDPLFSLKHSRANFAAFREAGGTGAFHDYIPPRGVTGHQIAAAPELWTEALEAYLAGQGLPARALPVGAQAVDGNTIRIEGTTYRLWGIDAPELAQRCYPHGWRAGIEAARTLAALVDRSPAVSCEARSVDRHGRTVALCRAGGKDLGAAMVEAGMALAVVGDSDYVEQEARATLLRAGVHGHACLAPGEWRAQQRLDN
jgi:endonuclease YncB( thermonuclease family)